MKRFCMRLWREEEGVALAFSVTVFLLVFLFGVAVYATGEIVRQRTELQNASDAAAYSAAVVQADTLSRVAMINQAMSWTYVMMSRRQMDYAVDKWLERVALMWDIDNMKAIQWNALSDCPHPFHRTRPSNYWCGYSGSDFQVFLNRSQMVNINTIKAARATAAGMGKSYFALGIKIQQDKMTIQAMNQAEQNLFSDLQSRITSVVEKAIAANISGTPNDDAAGGAEIRHCIIQDSPFNYTRVLKNNESDELDFFVHGKFDPTIKTISTRGVDKWLVRKPSGQEGIVRVYEQQFNSLLAEWQWYSIKWIYIPPDGPCTPTPNGGSNSVRGIDVYDQNFDGVASKPRILKENFFERPGALVVGLARKLNNPFAFLFSSGSPDGLFKAFTVPGGSRAMWTVSASRGGYYTPFEADRKPGAYEITFQAVGRDKLWNLREQDWDAIFLPVKHAWDKGVSRQWQSGDPSILSEVYSKLNAGSLSAPPGMQGGFDLMGAKEQLWH